MPPPDPASPDPGLLPSPDYRSILESAPALFLVLNNDAEFTILNASDAYLRATQTRRETILGRGLFDVFSDNPDENNADGVSKLRTSLETVLTTRSVHTMSMQKYGIRLPQGGFTERHWAPVNSPVTGRDGRVQCIVHRVDDVTGLAPAGQRRDNAVARLHEHTSAALNSAVDLVASTTPDLIYVFNLDHRFIYANKALLAMWGRTWEDAIGKNCLELGYEPWHAAMHDREIEQVIATKLPIRGEVAFHGTNGRRFYDYIFAPVIGANGEVEAIAGTTRDVTDGRKTGVAARFLADLMDRLAPLDNEREIISQTAKSLGRHLGVHRCYFVECLERENRIKVSENWVRDDAPDLAGCFNLHDYGGPEWWRQYAKGDFAVTDVDAHPLINPQQAENSRALGIRAYAVQPVRQAGDWRVVLAITDNQPRKWSDNDLRLLDNVAARVWPMVERVRSEQVLRAARDQALAASRAKDEFLATLSHELRTPLNPVLLVATESAADPSLPASVRADFKMIGDNIALQARLIDDLLDFSRIIHGKVKLERTTLDLHEIIRAATGTIREDIEAKGVRLEFALNASPSTIRGDPVRLRQVFWNVLKNAVKFTPANGRVEISSSSDRPDTGIEVRIRDSGVGLERGELVRLFSPFVQGRHADGDRQGLVGGLGLGLAIARMLLESHGGSIAAESPGPGAGATFIVRLPLQADPVPGSEHSEKPAATPVPAPADHLHSVLFVEDHEPTRAAMTRLLKRRGYEVTAAGSMKEALHQAAERGFDVLISDLGLPDGDGCMLFRQLRRTRPDLPGIALSGYGMDADLSRSREAGFAEHLTKPVGIDSLDRALSRVLSPVPTPLAPGR